MDIDFKVLNWNIGGAKFFELPLNEREMFKKQLNHALKVEMDEFDPDVVTLQEITEYSDEGDRNNPRQVVEVPNNYAYFPHILIDTYHRSHPGKWNKVRKLGGWKPNAYLAQGNAFLVHERLKCFPILSLPAVGVDYDSWQQERSTDSNLPSEITPNDSRQNSFIEDVSLHTGLYFGSRDTESRAASILHIVIDETMRGGERLTAPLDIFVINLHLTTLTMEREGVPERDSTASRTRVKQLDIVFDRIISRYNQWCLENFPIRNEHVGPIKKVETHTRHRPIWIIAGDFNFTPASNEYRYVIDRNFTDMINGSEHDRLGTKSAGLGKEPTVTVDYVFAGPLFWSLDPKFVRSHSQSHVVRNSDTKVSDHLPIKVRLQAALEFPKECKLCLEEEKKKRPHSR